MMRMFGAVVAFAAGLVNRSMSSAEAEKAVSAKRPAQSLRRIEGLTWGVLRGFIGLGAGSGDGEGRHAHADALGRGVVDLGRGRGRALLQRLRGDVPGGLAAERVARGEGAGDRERAL